MTDTHARTSAAEHIEWSKRRAREFLHAGDVPGAISSMISDLNKLDETRVDKDVIADSLRIVRAGTLGDARRFIDGF